MAAKETREQAIERLEMALASPLLFYTHGIASLKDDVDSMDAPIFSLTEHKLVRKFSLNQRTQITVIPSGLGAATVKDKDIWIYAISAVIHRLENGLETSPNVLINGTDFIKMTNRTASGRYYDEIIKALDRLTGTAIKMETLDDDGHAVHTNTISFPLIMGYRAVEAAFEDKRKNRFNIMVRLPPEVYAAILETRVLTIDESYFALKRSLDRRVYELARKHCGSQKEWKIKLENLHRKTGSLAEFKSFKRDLKKISIPDYAVEMTTAVDGSDMLIFRPQNQKKYLKKIAPEAVETDDPFLKPDPAYNGEPLTGEFDFERFNSTAEDLQEGEIIPAPARDEKPSGDMIDPAEYERIWNERNREDEEKRKLALKSLASMRKSLKI